jgi:hypothetical protein
MSQGFMRVVCLLLLLVSLRISAQDQRPLPLVDITTTPAVLVEGRAASFAVTVRGPNASDPVPTGSVVLLDGNAVLVPSSSPSAGLSGGRATLELPAVVQPGNHFYAVRYLGDNVYAPATSAGLTLSRPGDVILARCPLNPTFRRCIGLEGWLAATVLPRGDVVPTGTITLRRAGVAEGTETLAAGRADFPPISSRGSALVAEYSGDANYPASVSVPLNDDPQFNPIAIGDLILTSDPVPATVGVLTRFTATSISGTDARVQGDPVPNAVYTFSAGGRQVTVIADAVRGSASFDYTPSTADGSVQAVRAPAPGPAAPEYGVGRAVAQLVSQPVPVVAMVTTPFPLVAGEAATFQVTVQAAGVTSVPSGSVELRDGGASGAVVGTSPLDAAGTATVTLTSVPPGNHFYVARYVGDTLYAPATSPGVTVNRTGDVLLARCPPDAGPDFVQCQGQPDKLAVTVIRRGTTTPTGQVTLREGSRFVESASLISGRADFATPATAAANPSDLVVEYSGDANYPASVSSPLNDALRIGDVVLTSEPFPPQIGLLTRFTATTISGVPVPDATYTFAVDGRLIRTVADSANGSVSVEYTPQSGETIVTAARAPANGDVNYTSSQVTSMKLTGDALGGGGDGGGGGGCFIATAAYGSYLHPHVQSLRGFRDRVLMASSVGRSIVAVYYEYSPALAQRIERDPTAKVAARVALTPIVAFIAYPGPACAIVLLLIVTIVVVRGRHARRLRA